MRVLGTGLVGTLVLIAVVGTIYLRARGVKVSRLVSIWELLGFLLAAVFLISIILYYKTILDGLNAFVRWVTGSRESGGGGGSGESSGLPFGSPSAVLLVVAAVLVAAYVVVFAVAFFPKLYDVVAYEAPDVGRSKRELARAVRAAIRDLETGGDFRAAVLRCYQSMVLLFESRGTRADPSQTAREFEADALTRLGVSRGGVDDLTSLFEEARYSVHAIGEGQRDAAIGCLTAIRTELEAAA